MSYLLLSKYPPLCIRTIYGCIISSQNYKLQITNYIKVVGVCLPAAKEQKFIISRNKKDFSLIEKTGLSNLTTDYLTAMVKKYFML